MACQSPFEFSYWIFVPTEMKKVKLLTPTHQTGAQEESKVVGNGVMQGEKYILGSHVV